ncbi:MAG: ABC transporter permease [Clostridiales bacterium]|nr:ABC transporter permease [Clostridiales bacterium]
MLLMFSKKKQDQYIQELAETARRKSRWRDIWRRLLRNRLGMLGFVIVAILVVLVLFAPLFTRQDPAFQDFMNRKAFPSASHILGTDDKGRDIWTRLLYGGRISLMVSLVAVSISTVVGVFLGAIAGYFGGKPDVAITRLLDILMAVPSLLMATAISASLGGGPFNTALAISVSGIPHSMRLMRSTVLSIKTNEFVEAARATGSRHLRIIFIHILPNTIAPILVNSTLLIGGNIMAISGLSFIGLGVQPPTPEWGSILNEGRKLIREFWPIIVFPAMSIMLTVFGFNLFGDGLRDALDPRLKD